MAWAPLFAQVKFSVSTDKAVYHYGDSIHITLTAANTGSTTDTLVFPSTCQANYHVDRFDLLQRRACGQIVTYVVIPPHDSVTWSAPYLPPYPVTRDTLAVGSHAVVGEVIRYWISDTTWIRVSPETGVREGEVNSGDYFLEDNYPNPFNPSTILRYQLTATALVTIMVYDVLGREVATLVNEVRSVGTHSVRWDGSGQPSGIYFYRLQARLSPSDVGGQAGDASTGSAHGFAETKKMILLR